MAETITVNDDIGSKLVNLDDLKVAFDSLQTQINNGFILKNISCPGTIKAKASHAFYITGLNSISVKDYIFLGQTDAPSIITTMAVNESDDSKITVQQYNPTDNDIQVSRLYYICIKKS